MNTVTLKEGSLTLSNSHISIPCVWDAERLALVLCGNGGFIYFREEKALEIVEMIAMGSGSVTFSHDAGDTFL